MIGTLLTSRFVRPVARLAAIGLLALSALPAQAEFMGAGAIYAPYHCTWPTGVEMTRARYVPSTNNSEPSQVTLNFAVGGVNLYNIRADMAPSSAWRRSYGRSVWGGLYAMGTAPSVRVLLRQDAIYSGDVNLATSERMRLRLRIRNFNGEPGCSVSVALMLNRWD